MHKSYTLLWLLLCQIKTIKRNKPKGIEGVSRGVVRAMDPKILSGNMKVGYTVKGCSINESWCGLQNFGIKAPKKVRWL